MVHERNGRKVYTFADPTPLERRGENVAAAGGVAVLGGAGLIRAGQSKKLAPRKIGRGLRGAGLGMAAGGAAAALGGGGVSLHQTLKRGPNKHTRNQDGSFGGRRKVSKAEIEKKQWSEQQLKRRKKISGATSIATSTMGLGALGVMGLRSGSGKQAVKHLSRVAPKAGGHLKKIRGGLKGKETPILTTSAGVGGLGGYNYAAIQSQEAKRSAPKPKVTIVNNTKKRLNPKTGTFAKADTFNAERKRHRRNKVEAGALAVGSGGALAGAGYQAKRAGENLLAANRYKTKRAKGRLTKLGVARSSGAKGTALLAGGVVGAVGAKKLMDYEKSPKGRTYAPQHRPTR